MPKQEKKLILIFIFILSFNFLNASFCGFELTSTNIFLNKNNNPYYPEIISSFEATFFLSYSFIFNNFNLSISPAFFVDSIYNIEKRELGIPSIYPFFRRFNFSVFSEYISFTFAKDIIPFGEGFFELNDYFSLNDLVKKTTPIYHALFEIPINQFLFSLGSSIDTKAIEHFHRPEWYQTWAYASYANNIVSIDFESDVLFNLSSKKDIIFKIANELLLSLPLDFKIYTSIKMPLSLYNNKIIAWGAFMGGAKSFIIEGYNFTSILGLSYSIEGAGYSIFQNIGIKEIITFTIGLQGINRNNLYLVLKNTFFISALKFHISYITKNLIQDESMQGVFSIGVSLND